MCQYTLNAAAKSCKKAKTAKKTKKNRLANKCGLFFIISFDMNYCAWLLFTKASVAAVVPSFMLFLAASS